MPNESPNGSNGHPKKKRKASKNPARKPRGKRGPEKKYSEKELAKLEHIEASLLSDKQVANLAIRSGGPFREVEHDQKRAFLTVFALSGDVKRASEASGVSPQTHGYWMNSDSQYASEFNRALSMCGANLLQSTAIYDAIYGVKRYLWHQGEPVMWVNKETGEYQQAYEIQKIPKLMEFMLKNLMPDRYKDRREVSGPDGGPIELDINSATAEQLQVLNQLIDQSLNGRESQVTHSSLSNG
jgi:hypothetical protein